MSSDCGCETRGGREFKCQYHEGYFDCADPETIATLERELGKASDAIQEIGHAKDEVVQETERLREICPTPQQFRGLADYLLVHGNLDRGGVWMTALILQNKATKLETLAADRDDVVGHLVADVYRPADQDKP